MKTVTFDETKWKLVPVEPTYEMMHEMCGFDKDSRGGAVTEEVKTAYTAMINAAPEVNDDRE